MADPIRRGHAAKQELAETKDAFETIQSATVTAILAADTPEKAWGLILEHRALSAVRVKLQRVVDGGLIEEASQPKGD